MKHSARTLLLALVFAELALTGIAGPAWKVARSEDDRTFTMTVGDGALAVRLNLDGRCVLDQVMVRGTQVLGNSGVCSGLRTSNQWFTSGSNQTMLSARASSKSVEISGIRLGSAPAAEEVWVFRPVAGGLEWRIRRKYLGNGRLEDVLLPGWEFAAMTTWTGGILDHGGVAWNRYLDTPNATLGTHATAVTLWSRDRNDCLRLAAEAVGDTRVALRFSRQPSGSHLVGFSVSETERQPRHGLTRFLGSSQEVWAPLEITPSETEVLLRISAADYGRTYSRGRLAGIDEGAVRELMNTIGRYGVIDHRIVGANGWRTGFACLHEQWFSQIGIALMDPAYLANCAASYDFERDHAIQPDGRVKARWWHNPGDAMPGTYDKLGFYEAQWGYLMDSQPCFAICVAELFDLTGDRKWLRDQKEACERALEYLLRRDADGDGLVEMMTDSHTAAKGSDWIDVIWASHENALVNAELYYALLRWTELEELLEDSARAKQFRVCAEKLKAQFNKPIAEGGFWNEALGSYVYWRNKDGSVHGTNLVTPVQFTALGYGLCDDEARRGIVLEGIERLMEQEHLFFWPLNFQPYQAEEGHAINFPYPNYENGDIFLSWGELGIRAYSGWKPELALKYVRNVLAKYEQDGLSSQRYQRQSQRGAGEDILAGNCMAIVGLYRDIYGVQPRHDRLYLEPRLTAELNGTQLRYTLREQEYTIDLSTAEVRASVEGFAFCAKQAFGLSADAKSARFYRAATGPAVLEIERSPRAPVEVIIRRSPGKLSEAWEWSESTTAKRVRLHHRLDGFPPGAKASLRAGDRPPVRLTADRNGRVEFDSRLVNGQTLGIRIEQSSQTK